MSEQTTTEEPNAQKTVVAIDRANTLVVNPTLRPIYPVRYAYANFIGDAISAPAEPPPLAELLDKSEASETQGYMARILRPGWVYIREEEGGDHFHIFQYQQIENNGKLEERFPKFQFNNGINAQDGLKQDNSGSQKGGYPFAFVRKQVTEISIAYSEHEWHPDVIDKMNGDANERANAMQRVNLIDDDTATVEATSNNLKGLVEDYRTKQNRILNLKESDTDPSVKDLSLDILTTSASYDIAAEQLAVQLRARAKNLQQGKTARIIALYDPVGRQRDIAEVHAKLALWEKNYASSNIYPFTVGQIVNQLRQTEDEDLKEIVEDSINWKEHDDFWQEMSNEQALFVERQEQFLALYKAFMMDDSLTGKVGSLDTYFTKFFCTAPKNSEEVNQEIQKLCHISEGIFNGILTSQQGRVALNDIGSDTDNSQNAYMALFGEVFTRITTTPQFDLDWSATTARLFDQKVLMQLGTYWGEMFSWGEYGVKLGNRAAHKGAAKSAHFVIKTLMPWVFDLYGIKITPGETVKFSADELAKVLSKHIGEGADNFPGQNPAKALKAAERKLGIANKLFNWGENIERKQLPKLWEASKVEVVRDTTGRHTYVVPANGSEAVGLLFDSGFAGLSACLNIKTMWDLAHQSDYDKTNPLARGDQIQEISKLTSAITALTADLLTTARAGVGIGAAVSTNIAAKNTTGLAAALAPKLSKHAAHLGKLLASRLVSGLIAVANLAAAVDAYYSAQISYRQGNTGEMVGHAMVMGGSSVLFGLATYAFFAGASTGVGVLIGTIAAIALIVAGVITLFIFGRSDFEILLRNCFWGNGRQYAFWVHTTERPIYIERLSASEGLETSTIIANAYQQELQEFMNYFYQPKLTMEDDHSFLSFEASRTYDLTFTLPNFQQGVSDIHYSVRTIETIPANTRLGFTTEYQHNEQLTAAFQAAANQARFSQNKGATTLHIRFKADENIQLHWYYQPQPNIISPQRFLTGDGLQKQAIIGMINEGAA